MSNNRANFLAGTVFISLFFMFIYLIATSRATHSQIGISLGEAAIPLIIIAAIPIWSAAQIFVSVRNNPELRNRREPVRPGDPA
jgi:PIN domain nuclease of toxin-antitoxin system